MRRMVALTLLLCWANAEPGGTPLPTCRCVLAARPEGGKTVAETSLPELDKRLLSEATFLKGLYGVEAELLLLADEPARRAFTVIGDDGKATVLVSAAWLREVWAEENRVATVAAILAHQYAHVLQAKRKCPLPEWSRERHADFLAGWYLGKRNVATLGSGKDLDAAFAASLFDTPDEFLNARFDHGAPAARVAAIRQGFNVLREARLPLDKAYKDGLALFPPPNEGILDAPEKPQGLLARVKIECTHKGPCNHQVACTHPQPCVHKVACTHQSPCVHKTRCIHQVPCEHRKPCVHKRECIHRTRCQHKTSCVHPIPCRHRDAEGKRIHDFDYAHNFDYEHDWDYEHEFDYEHEYDTEHVFDIPHEFDTEHPFDPVHEFDWAHEWDPVHPFDLAHEWDPVHDYDVRLEPQGGEGASGAK